MEYTTSPHPVYFLAECSEPPQISGMFVSSRRYSALPPTPFSFCSSVCLFVYFLADLGWLVDFYLFSSPLSLALSGSAEFGAESTIVVFVVYIMSLHSGVLVQSRRFDG